MNFYLINPYVEHRGILLINSLDLLFSFFKRNVFSLVLILILLPYSFTLLFSCDQPQIETTLPFAYQNQGWT
jgi:hypothetical protein